MSRACCRNGAGGALRAVASVALAAASLIAPAAAYGAVEEKAEQNITFSIPTSLRCAVRADGTVIAPSGWSMSNSGSGKVEITGVSVSNAIGKLRLSGRSGSVGYAVGEGSGSYSVSYDAAGVCKFSSSSNRPLGIESGKSLSWNWNIGKLDASDHRAALDAAVSGRARLCDMSFSYAPVGNSLSSAGTTGSMSGTVDNQSSFVVPVGGTATANVGNAPSNATFSYQWYTVDPNGSYSAIANANGKTLKVLAAYRGKDIVCRVSDSSGHYSGYVETARKPVRNLAPKVGISGSAVYGGKLTAAVSGLPSGATYTYKYRWQRLSGSSWADIANATTAEYMLGGEDVGKQIRVIVSTASNIYTVDDVSAVSATVAKAKVSIGVSISGTKNNSSRLTASVSGLPAAGANTVSYRWQRSSDGKSNWVDSTAGDAKSNSIQMQPNDVSWHYRCIVSVSNPYYDIASSTSAAYGPIAKSTVSAVKATISGNAVYGGTIKANVTNVPTVGTNSISYRWQYSDDGKTWNDTRLTGGTTSSLVLSAVSCVGTQYRCVISVDSSYYIVPGCTTDGVKVGKASVQAIAKASGEAVAGKKLTVSVSGLPTVGGTNKVSYQWQFSNDGGKTWGGSTLNGTNTSTLCLYDDDNVTHCMIGYSYRCVVTVSGNSAYDIKSATSNVIGPVVKGTAAAPSVSVSGTKKIESALKATVTGLPKYGNSNVSYQWQTSADGSTWADSTQSDAKSVSFKPAYSLVGKYVRCAVSVSNDQYNVATGYSAAFGKLGKASKTISAAITSPNKRNGDPLTCGISGLASNGSNTIAYKWECAGNSAFTSNVEVLDDRGNIHGTSVGTGTYYRCTVTASNPYYEYNTAVSPIYGPLAKGVASVPTVTVSGSNAWGSTLKATVSGLPKFGTNKVSYQWEARDDSSTAWGNSGYATATTDHITVDAQDAVSKAGHYRCKVTVDNDQYTVPVAYSADHGKTVKASATAKAAISGTAVVGGKLTCSVSGLPTSGSNAVSYQWQYSNDNRTWTNSTYTDAKTSSHSLGYKDAYNLYWRCAVSVANPYYSVPIAYTDSRLCGKGTASITASVSGNAVIGGKLTCSVGGLPSIGTNSVKYRWQYSSDGKAWTDSANATASSNSITLPPDATLGKYFRCVVSATNAMYNDMSATSAASAKVGKGSHSAPSVSISGAKVYGSTLTASVSGQPTGTTGTSYQWQRASSSTGTWSNIANATGKTYKLGTGDMNQYLRVLVGTTSTYYTVSQGASSAYGTIGKAAASISATASGSKVIESAITANVTGLPSVGTNTVSYQWQWSNDNKTWTSSTQGDAKTKTITPNYTWAGVYARCVISVSGNAYYNINGYTLNVGQIGKGTKTVSVSLTGNAVVGGSLKANVSGLPSNGTNTVAYQWQYSSDNKTWTDSNSTGAKSNAITTDTTWLNKYARCVVTVSGNAYYNVNGATSSAYGPMGKASHSAPSVSISGSKVYGATLTANVSGQPSGTTGTTYQWQRATSASGSYSNIANATGKTYVAAAGDMNHYLRVLVNTANTYYNVSQGVSAGYGPIGKASHSAPSVSVSGDKSVGATLTASVSGQPGGTTSTTYQWQRASSAGGSYSNISGATGKTYKTVDADANKYVRVLVNTANTYYNVSQGVSVGYGAILVPKSFAVYSDGDKSLKFYRRASVPRVASTFNGQVVTALYENIESTAYSSVPWSSRITQIEAVDIVDSGIKPANISGWFNGATSLTKIDNMSKLDVSATKDMSYAFSGCENLTKIDLSSWNTASCTNMSYMFSSCKHLMQVNVSSFRTSSVTDFSSMFYQCSNITDLDISNFDTRKATSISLMMAETLHMQRFKIGANFRIVGTNFVGMPSSINIPDSDSRWHSSTGGIYTSATIPSLKADTYYALANRTCVQQAYAVYSSDDNSLLIYKRSDVPDIGHTFNGKTATCVYPNIEAYDDTTLYHASPWSLYVAFLRTAKVIDSGIQPRSTAWWFYLCTSMTTCDLNKLDTSKCVNMCWMFRSCSSLTTLDVSKLDTHLVTDLSSMFRDSPELGELDVRNWNVSKATNMGNMFNSCRRLTNLTGAENWNTSSNEHFDNMFANCVKLTLNASRWDTSAAKGATKHTGFNLSAPGVRAPQWHGVVGLNTTSVENDSNPDMPSDDIAVDSDDIQDDKSACDRNGNSNMTADGAIHDDINNSDNMDSVDYDIENRQSPDDATSNEPLPEQLE